ncbi:NAD(P)H-binding protein [Loigolactobacillus jiayinensis]|uniref:NAD(P)H-binding protein n=1 Tax=Loigolactobacillus jiayinensis TaxID=2486016 RepID=A0ABW1RE37_9LACO|nr:NAD(P)H-binding protein [Loigolactobacillus jiayinensis]
MMKIGIIGATGRVGSAILNEAEARGHKVTALVRNADKAKEMFGTDAAIIEKDALALDATDLNQFDVVVDAFASPEAYQHLDLATKLISLFRNNKQIRLMFIVGSSSLKKADGTRMLDDVLKMFANEPWVATPIQQVHELEFLQWVDNVDWSAISPQVNFEPGKKTQYHVGTDEVMENKAGKQAVSFGNFAGALVDELEAPQHKQQRFTVVDD